jgi:hypothetical protein
MGREGCQDLGSLGGYQSQDLFEHGDICLLTEAESVEIEEVVLLHVVHDAAEELHPDPWCVFVLSFQAPEKGGEAVHCMAHWYGKGVVGPVEHIDYHGPAAKLLHSHVGASGEPYVISDEGIGVRQGGGGAIQDNGCLLGTTQSFYSVSVALADDGEGREALPEFVTFLAWLVVAEHLVDKLGGCYGSSGHGKAYFGLVGTGSEEGRLVGTGSEEGRQHCVDSASRHPQQQGVDIWEVFVSSYSTQTMQVQGKVSAMGVGKRLLLACTFEL